MPRLRRTGADLPGRAAAALAPSGLILRGGLNFTSDEQRPTGPGGHPAAALLLVGNAGARYWQGFTLWRARQVRPLSDPLDSWSRAVIGAAAREIGARVLMPNDKPFAPFQQWAMRAEGLRPSPLGLLMHPRYGLWHAFRGALLLEAAISPQALLELNRAGGGARHPCDLCAGKPCLNACPVAAHTGKGFAHAACVSHVRSRDGTACARHCLARNACPHGTEWRYPAEVQAFHQRAFAGA